MNYVCDPLLFWTIPPHKTLIFWATYLIWGTATWNAAIVTLSRPKPLSTLESCHFFLIAVLPVASAVGLIRDYRHIRRALSEAPELLNSQSGIELLTRAANFRFQLLCAVIAMSGLESWI